MHCPRCGQQQISEDIKFCSRCGFPLALTAEILANGGFLPILEDLHKNKKKLTRNLGLKVSLVWFLVITFLLVPFAAITKAPGDIVAVFAVIGFCGALLLMVMSILFLKNEPKTSGGQNQFYGEPEIPQYSGGNPAQQALPPQTSQPVSSYARPADSWKAPETGDLVPHSVTEGTTRLLQKEE